MAWRARSGSSKGFEGGGGAGWSRTWCEARRIWVEVLIVKEDREGKMRSALLRRVPAERPERMERDFMAER